MRTPRRFVYSLFMAMLAWPITGQAVSDDNCEGLLLFSPAALRELAARYQMVILRRRETSVESGTSLAQNILIAQLEAQLRSQGLSEAQIAQLAQSVTIAPKVVALPFLNPGRLDEMLRQIRDRPQWALRAVDFPWVSERVMQLRDHLPGVNALEVAEAFSTFSGDLTQVQFRPLMLFSLPGAWKHFEAYEKIATPYDLNRPKIRAEVVTLQKTLDMNTQSDAAVINGLLHLWTTTSPAMKEFRASAEYRAFRERVLNFRLPELNQILEQNEVWDRTLTTDDLRDPMMAAELKAQVDVFLRQHPDRFFPLLQAFERNGIYVPVEGSPEVIAKTSKGNTNGIYWTQESVFRTVVAPTTQPQLDEFMLTILKFDPQDMVIMGPLRRLPMSSFVRAQMESQQKKKSQTKSQRIRTALNPMGLLRAVALRNAPAKTHPDFEILFDQIRARYNLLLSQEMQEAF
ncbi:MAG: hypothetical protein AB7N80_11800 [Bdellovibrionales bacterium]